MAIFVTAVASMQGAMAQSTGATPSQSSVQAFDAITIMGEQQQEQTPWATQTDRRVLDEQQILNFDELGSRALPGVNFSAVTNSINIRGLDQNRVVTRVDGIRQPYLQSDLRGTLGRNVRGGLTAIDFNSLNSVDVVRGANSSTVGSGAMGGVVDLRTLSPSDLLTGQKSLGFAARTGYYSVDDSWLVNAAVAGQTQGGLQWLLQAGGQFGHQTINQGTVGGIGPSRTEPNPSSYTQQSYLLKLQQTFLTNHTVGLSANYYDRKINIDDLTSDPNNAFTGRPLYIADQSRATEQIKRQGVSLDYGWAANGTGALIDTFAAQVYWQQVALESESTRQRLASPRPPSNPQGFPFGRFARSSQITDDSYGLNLEATKRIDGTVSQFWDVGAEYLNTRLKQLNTASDNCPSYGRGAPGACGSLHATQNDLPNTTGNQYALWLQNTLGFAGGRFELTPGLRYDYYQYSPGAYGANPGANNIELSNSSASAWSPKILAQWNATNSLAFYGQYALSFNAPTPTQLYGLFEGFAGPSPYLILGNPNLKPERGHGWELGTKFENQSVSGSLSFFDNRYKSFINEVSQDTPGFVFVNTFENLDNVRIYGIEASGSWNITSNWRTFASLAWTVGKDQTTNRDLNTVAPLQALAGLGYFTDQWGASAQLVASQRRNNVSDDAQFIAPGYGVVNLTGYWSPTQLKGLTLQLGVFNVFDKSYWNALDVPGSTPRAEIDRFTQPGRNVSLTLSYRY